MANSQFFPSDRPRIPPELQLMVIEELKDDSNTLSACSLVTKTWLSTSRAHLFRTIFLTVSIRKDTSQRFTDFLHFLQELPKLGPGSKIPEYIEELNFHGEPFDDDGLDPPQEVYHAGDDDPECMNESHVPLCISTVLAYVQVLPRLNSLEFYHVLLLDGPLPTFLDSVPSDGSDMDYLVTPTLPELHQLRFIDCSAPHYDLVLLLGVMSFFTAIEQLSIVGGTWELLLIMDYVLSHQIPTGRLPPVNWLRLINPSGDWIEALEAIFKNQAAEGTPLRILDVKAQYYLEDFFGQTLPALTSQHLVKLTIYLFDAVCIHPESSPLPPEWDLVLPNLPSLTTLELDLDCQLSIDKDQRAKHMRNAIRVYSSLLASSTSLDRISSLSTVTFQVHDGVIAYYIFRKGAREGTIWKDFGEALAGLPPLAVVQFVLNDTDEAVGPNEKMRQRVEGFIAEYIPQLAVDLPQPTGEGRIGRRYRVLLEGERDPSDPCEPLPWLESRT